MRVPQRNFVVEFKTRSRQSKASKRASIWGDTDLKAVARQVEEQSAYLSGTPAEGPMTVDVVAPVELQSSAAVTPAPEDPATHDSADVPLARMQNTGAAPTDPDLSSDVEGDQPLPGSTTHQAQGPAITKTERRARRPKHTAFPKRLKKQETHISRDDLTALEAENEHLKALLRKQLASENKLLSDMLKRFL